MDRQLVERRINEAIATSCKQEVNWARDNCAFWCADIVGPLIDYDLVKDFRDRFRSRSGAYRIMGGPSGLKKIMDRMAIDRKWAWVPPPRALPGDIGVAVTRYVSYRWRVIGGKRMRVLVELPAASIVICRHPGWFVARGDQGFASIPAHKVMQAWAVK